MRLYQLICLLAVFLFTGCQKKLVSTESGLQYRILQKSKGEEIAPGDIVTTHCLLLLEDGTEIWSTHASGETFSFTYGEDRLIEGFDEMISYMKVGEKVEVTIPPQLGYGERGAGNDIPPNATLTFVIEILDSKTP